MEIIKGHKLPINQEFWYEAQQRTFWKNSYDAGDKYVISHDERLRPVLRQHAGETNESYQNRIDQADVPSYVSNIVDIYTGFADRHPVNRPTSPTWYTEFIESVDSNDTTISEFMKKALTLAFIEKYCFILVNNDADEVETAAEAAAVKARWKIICANNVPYFKEEFGVVKEAIVMLDEYKRGYFEAIYLTDGYYRQLKLQKTGNYTGTLAASSECNLIVEEVGPEIESFDKCPLVMLDLNLNLVEHVANSQRAILNLQSSQDTCADRTVFNVSVITGAEDLLGDGNQGPGNASLNRRRLPMGNGTTLVLPQGATLEFKTPPSTAIDSIEMMIKRRHEQIYQYAGVGNSSTSQAESGVAKVMRFDEVQVRVITIAKAEEKAENRAMKITAQILGQEYPGNATYSRDFSIPDLMEDLERYQKMGGVVPKVIKRQEAIALASHYDLTDEQKKELEDELDGEPEPENEVTTPPSETPPPAPEVEE